MNYLTLKMNFMKKYFKDKKMKSGRSLKNTHALKKFDEKKRKKKKNIRKEEKREAGVGDTATVMTSIFFKVTVHFIKRLFH